MEAGQQLLFFFSALGVFNGLLLAVYLLFFLRPARLRNRLLGLLLLALSVRIGKSVFLYFNQELYRLFLQIGLTACFFIGPLLWAYVRAGRDGLEKPPRAWWFGLGVLVAVALAVGLWRPYTHYPAFWGGGGMVQVIYAVWALGIVAAGVVLWPVLRRKERSNYEFWMLNIWAGNLIVHLAYRYGTYGSYIVGALSFSFVFYLLGLGYILRRRQRNFLVADSPKYRDRKIGAAEADDLLARCAAVMETDRPYLDPGFKLADLAGAAGSTPHRISQLLNDNLGQGFTAYLHTYRVNYARRLIRTEDHLTLEAIGERAGFGSKSAFYAAFRTVTGTTPARYRRSAD